VLRLDNLDLHLDKPASLDAETELRLRAAPATANRNAQILVQISPESFTAMATPRMNPAPAVGPLAVEPPQQSAPGAVPDETPDSNTSRKASSV